MLRKISVKENTSHKIYPRRKYGKKRKGEKRKRRDRARDEVSTMVMMMMKHEALSRIDRENAARCEAARRGKDKERWRMRIGPCGVSEELVAVTARV